jgi:hypothetical protein
MNYQKIHDQIIERAKTRILNSYKERHHIIPRCLGGSNNKDNLVDLTAREHFIIHLLLSKIHPENRKLSNALWLMANVKREYQHRHNPSSRLYEIARLQYSKNNQKENNPMFGRKHSDETKQKIKESRIGKYKKEDNSFYGKKHTEETIKKIKEKRALQQILDETRQKMSTNRKGKVSGRKGKVNSEEHNKKASESLKEYWRLKKQINSHE